MDYFNGITNDDLRDYYLIDLHSRKELIQYQYPHEFLEPGDAVDDHIIRCHSILHNYLINILHEYEEEELKAPKINEICEKKLKELFDILRPYDEEYFEKAKVTHITL